MLTHTNISRRNRNHGESHLKYVWIYVARCELSVYFWHEQNWAAGSVAARPRR